jgi:hypothetical protein
MAKKTAALTTPKVSKLAAYKIRATNIVRELLNPTRRGAFDAKSHDMVNGVLKPNMVAVNEFITIAQTADRFGSSVVLKASGNGPQASLIVEFIDNPKSEASAFLWE